MTFAQDIEDDVVWLSTSLEVSAVTVGTSLTTSVHLAEAMADHSNDDDSTSITTKKSHVEASEYDLHTEGISTSDRQMILSAAQIMGCVIESPSAVVVGVTGAQLSKEFIHRDTSLMKVIQQQMKLESKELTARMQEKYDIHKVRATDCTMQGVSNVDLESRSKSMSKEHLHTKNMETAKLSTITTSEPSPRQTVKGIVGPLSVDENLSPAILYAFPISFSGSEAGTAASLINEIHGTVAKEDNVAYSPASSLSPSPLTSAVRGEAFIGKPVDHIAENNDSGGKFTVPTSSSLAQEEWRQNALEVNSKHDWQINIQWILDNKEPPPSYEDIVLDYDNSPIGPSNALLVDHHQCMRQYMQCYGDDKSSTLDITSDEFQQRSEEGASALE
ncbi:hypothetical protein HD554DRAFT_2040149 [Boletus coccyginus]|nr:hypothetical protein HD554DRAFT_2040149 [Boletus coccyginus]